MTESLNISHRSDGPGEIYFRTMAAARMNVYQPKWAGHGASLPPKLPVTGALEVKLQPHSFAILEHADPSLEA
jgi:hypothetical protein